MLLNSFFFFLKHLCSKKLEYESILECLGKGGMKMVETLSLEMQKFVGTLLAIVISGSGLSYS